MFRAVHTLASEHRSLPEPQAAERDVSERLLARIHAEIEQAGGAIQFDRYMALALYEPGLGYYAAGRRKFGAAGDFVTAPELSPLFGACVATQIGRWLPKLPAVIWEFGAGSGELAAQLLAELEAIGFGAVDYRIVEVSAELRARQHARIAERAPWALPRVQWVDVLPDRIDGIVIANELLDALPVRLFELGRGEVLERMVASASLARGGLEFVSRPADPVFVCGVRERLIRAGWDDGDWAPGYGSELGEQAQAWVASVAERLRDGVMLLIDYGFPAAEFFHPGRATGTLNCHYRHRSHADPLWWPGLCDITTHVDFSAVYSTANAAGLTCLGYASQAAFLIGARLTDHFASRQPDDPVERARLAQSLQLLVSEAEMGELFKVIAFGRGDLHEPLMLAGRDRQGALADAGIALGT